MRSRSFRKKAAGAACGSLGLVRPPASTGSVTNLGNGVWTWSYTPGDGPDGPTVVTVTATDDSTPALTSSVTFTVAVTNVAPVAQAQTVTVLEDSAATSITLQATEPGADVLTYEIVSPPLASKGTLGTLSGDAVTFTPTPGFAGQATFTFKVTDSDTAVSNIAMVTVNVTAINDLPSFVKGADRSHPAGFCTTQTVAGWASSITDGDAEVAQTLTFAVTEVGSSGIFTVNPSISTTGALTYRTNGTA
eukprot:gene45614-55827_t